jgi:septum formation protein
MLHEKLKNYRLILASQSSRRQALIKGLDIAVTIAPAYHVNETFPASMIKDAVTIAPAYHVNETFPASMTKEEVPAFLALEKSEAYPYQLEERDILITADTLVLCKDEFLGKPTDEADARRMLRLISGCTHKVVTGVCLRSYNKTTVFLASTLVTLRQLEEDEISYYLTKYQPYDKAGAYGIQEWIGYAAIERIEGSYYNVMGLPLQQLYKKLEQFVA